MPHALEKRSRTNGNAAVMAVRSRRGTMPPVSGRFRFDQIDRSVVIKIAVEQPNRLFGNGPMPRAFRPQLRRRYRVWPSPSKSPVVTPFHPADESIEAELSRDFSELPPLS